MSEHRCWGCGVAEDTIPSYGTNPGASRPIPCGALCPDCSWQAHLASRAYAGEFDDVKAGTPACCVETRRKQEEG